MSCRYEFHMEIATWAVSLGFFFPNVKYIVTMEVSSRVSYLKLGKPTIY